GQAIERPLEPGETALELLEASGQIGAVGRGEPGGCRHRGPPSETNSASDSTQAPCLPRDRRNSRIRPLRGPVRFRRETKCCSSPSRELPPVGSVHPPRRSSLAARGVDGKESAMRIGEDREAAHARNRGSRDDDLPPSSVAWRAIASTSWTAT